MQQISGQVSSEGVPVLGGRFYSVENPKKGVFDVNYNTDLFTIPPVVVVTPITTGDSVAALSITSSTADSFSININYLDVDFVNLGFTFIATEVEPS